MRRPVIRIGIDNGADGAIVAINDVRDVIWASQTPHASLGVKRRKKGGGTKQGTKRVAAPADARDVMRHILGGGTPGVPLWMWEAVRLGPKPDVFAVLEYAQSMPGQGISTTFEYARFYMMWQATLAAFGVPYEIVRPQAWQKAMLKGVEGTNKKAKAMLKAQRTITGIDWTLFARKPVREGVGDAGCMALHALDIRPVAQRPQAAPEPRSTAPTPPKAPLGPPGPPPAPRAVPPPPPPPK
tara:strand:+ start:3973 stop:4695 length:723 start_codon:yes stop_codon:yes gene_type:complete